MNYAQGKIIYGFILSQMVGLSKEAIAEIPSEDMEGDPIFENLMELDIGCDR